MAKILVVDDSEIIRNQLNEILAGGGHEAVEAADGAEGLAKTKEDTFDLIITDYNMPELNGVEMTKAIREVPGYADVNVLMLTTEAGVDLKKKGKEVGIRAWIVKPPKGELILKAIDKLLSKKAA